MTASKLGFNGAWAMAVGGMIGGGIFSTLGIVVAISGSLAWLSFLAAGLIALAAGYSYIRLAIHYDEPGGAFTYLRKVGAVQGAGTLSWVVITGYVLTNSVYAFTFGEYLAYVLGQDGLFVRIVAVAILLLFTTVNLRGVGENSAIEIFLVWFKVVALLGLAVLGLAQWDTQMLARGVPDEGIDIALFGAASIFMAYEGFQLLAYDYDDIESPRRILPRALLSAVLSVIAIYVLVALGVPMLIGADQVVLHQEVALAQAGQQAGGMAGLIVMTVAAAFSTGSAINSTLFATARLARLVADKGELPSLFGVCNDQGIPTRSVIMLGGMSAVMAAMGSLTSLVEVASLAFLGTFTIVCIQAFRLRAGCRLITGAGALAASLAAIALVWRLLATDLPAILMFLLLLLVALFIRPRLLAWLGVGRQQGQ